MPVGSSLKLMGFKLFKIGSSKISLLLYRSVLTISLGDQFTARNQMNVEKTKMNAWEHYLKIRDETNFEHKAFYGPVWVFFFPKYTLCVISFNYIWLIFCCQAAVQMTHQSAFCIDQPVIWLHWHLSSPSSVLNLTENENKKHWDNFTVKSPHYSRLFATIVQLHSFFCSWG